VKISDIITRFDELKPNKYSSATKLGWINHVDGSVWNELYKYTAIAALTKTGGAYDLPAGVTFDHLISVFVDGDEIFKVSTPNTTGYYRNSTGKLVVYPDTTGTVSIVHKLPFVPHAAITEDVYIPAPYDKVYDDYLTAMVDKYNQEMDKYANSLNFYNASFDEFAAWYRKQGVT
jgi:hypothetical protein